MGHTGGLLSRLIKYWWASLALKEGALSKNVLHRGAVAYQLGNTSSRMITEVKQH